MESLNLFFVFGLYIKVKYTKYTYSIFQRTDNIIDFSRDSIFFLFLAHADQFIVVKAPKSLEFKSDSDILADNIQDVFSASLGYSVPTSMDSSNWDGLRVTDPFNVAEGLVSVIVDGLDSLDVKVRIILLFF